MFKMCFTNPALRVEKGSLWRVFECVCDSSKYEAPELIGRLTFSLFSLNRQYKPSIISRTSPGPTQQHRRIVAYAFYTNMPRCAIPPL